MKIKLLIITIRRVTSKVLAIAKYDTYWSLIGFNMCMISMTSSVKSRVWDTIKQCLSLSSLIESTMDSIFPIHLMEKDYSVINNKRLNRQLKCATRCHTTLVQLDSTLVWGAANKPIGYTLQPGENNWRSISKASFTVTKILCIFTG